MLAEVIGHRLVVGDRRVGPTCHNDPHLGGRPRREQTGDAVRVGAGRDAAVLIEPVDDQNQPPACGTASARGPVEQFQLRDYRPWFDNARQLRALVTELENLTLRMIDNDPRWGSKWRLKSAERE